MWASLGSSRGTRPDAGRPLRIALFWSLLALLLAGGAHARVRATGTVSLPGDSGRVVRHVRISDAGVRVTRGLPDTTDADADSDGGVVVSDHDAGIVRLFSDADVPAGERVEGDVVAVFGSVHVAGTVTGTVVAVLGSITLEPGASVEGDAVSIGGGLHQPAGSHVSGESVSLGFNPLTFGLPALPVLLALIGLGWMVSLLLGWLFALLFPERLVRISATGSRRTTASFFLGAASLPLCMIAGLLLFVTVVGIPIAILLPLIYLVVVYAGQLAATYGLGCKLTGRTRGEGSPFMPLLAGTLFVAAFFAVGAVLWMAPGVTRPLALFSNLLGLLLLVTLSTIGTGAFMLSGAGSRPRSALAPAGLGEASGPGAAAPGPATAPPASA